MDHDELDGGLFAVLADRLLLAHRAVRALGLDDAEKSSVLRRLTAISDTSKHSLEKAAPRLEALLDELRERHPDEMKALEDPQTR